MFFAKNWTATVSSDSGTVIGVTLLKSGCCCCCFCCFDFRLTTAALPVNKRGMTMDEDGLDEDFDNDDADRGTQQPKLLIVVRISLLTIDDDDDDDGDDDGDDDDLCLGL